MTRKKLTILLIVLLCVAVLAIVIVSVARVNNNRKMEQYETLLEQAEQMYRTGDLDAAISLYQEGTRLEPDQTEAWMGLADLYEEQGDVAAAVEVLYEASKSVRDSADRDALLERMNELEDSLRYDENNPPPASDENGETPDNPEDSVTSTVPDPDREEDGPGDPADDPGETEGTQEDTPPEDSPEEDDPEDDPENSEEVDITGIAVDTELLDNVLSMNHAELVQVYGAATAINTDWGVMVTYQRSSVSFFYGYAYDGLVDPNTLMPYDYAFSTSAAFGSDTGLISGQTGTTLSMKQLAQLFDATPSCSYNEMDQIWNVSVPYGSVTLQFFSDEDGNVDLTDLIWIYQMNEA